MTRDEELLNVYILGIASNMPLSWIERIERWWFGATEFDDRRYFRIAQSLRRLEERRLVVRDEKGRFIPREP